MDYWKIKFETSAEKDFKKLDPQSQKLIMVYLEKKVINLDNPKLLGKGLINKFKGYWRYRVNKFRIICKIKDDALIVLIVKIAKRDIVYEE